MGYDYMRVECQVPQSRSAFNNFVLLTGKRNIIYLLHGQALRGSGPTKSMNIKLHLVMSPNQTMQKTSGGAISADLNIRTNREWKRPSGRSRATWCGVDRANGPRTPQQLKPQREHNHTLPGCSPLKKKTSKEIAE